MDQSIRRPVGIVEDIPVRIKNSFVSVDFVVLEMDVCHQILLILGRPFLSTTGATIDVAARIIKLDISRKEETSTLKPKGTEKCNQVMVMIKPERIIMLDISRKEETSTLKPKGTEKCNQVMVMIKPERSGMTPDKKPSAAKNFSMKFSRCVKNATLVATRFLVAPAN
jgi:hypothetical protein